MKQDRMSKKYFTELFEVLNEYSLNSFNAVMNKAPEDKKLVTAFVYISIKIDRRTTIGKIIASLVDDNDTYCLSFDEFNKYYTLEFKNIPHYAPYTYKQFAYEEINKKLSSLTALNTSVYFRMD